MRLASTALWVAVLLAGLGCGREAQQVPATSPLEPSEPKATAEDSSGAEPESIWSPDPALPGAPNAIHELGQTLAEEALRSDDPADGKGRAWLEEVNGALPQARAAEPGRFPIVFEAGPGGIAVGGRVLLQVQPFWGWSTPQVEWPDELGYTAVRSDAEGVILAAATLDEGLLGVEIGGRALAPGERLWLDYGAGAAGALADRFAEQGSLFFIGVDGDGDGRHAWIPDPPRVDVAAGPAAQLIALLPGLARPGETVRLRVSVLDAAGSTGVDFAGLITLGLPDGVEGPEVLVLERSDGGRGSVELIVSAAGVVRVVATTGELSAETNPLLVSADGPRILWADLHGHSQLSDGTGTPADYYRYARDVAALDAASLTDHDHWGIPFLDETPDNWRLIREANVAFHAPGEFVALLGYEWTHWIYGHRHVLYFGEEGPIWSSVDPRSDTPPELWERLRGSAALTFAHHSAGQPVATDWSIPPDPELEPLTEIASVHGSSESLDTPFPVRGGVAGNFVRDALQRGYRFGFVGSGDSHDGHPGLAQLASPTGGLAAILAEDRTRAGLHAALRARRTYATNGPRIALGVTLAGQPMGSLLPAGLETRLAVRAVAPGEIDALEVVADGQVVERIPGEGRRDVSFESGLRPMAPGSWLYVRVLQSDGGAAWSSPFYFE